MALLAVEAPVFTGCDSDDTKSNEAEIEAAEKDRKKAEAELAKAQKEASEARAELDGARDEIERAQGESEELEAKQKELDDAEQKLKDAEKALDEAMAAATKAEDEAASSSVYAMTVHAFGPDTTTSYLVTMPSLEEGTLMDLDSAIELPDYANVTGIAGKPSVWLSDFSTPIIERWDVTEDNSLKRGATVSFANLGASSVSQGAQGAFVSAELAALPSQDTGELILWNPTTMEIIGTIDLEIPDKDGIAPLIRSTVPRPDGTLVLSYYYINSEGVFADGAGIVVVDLDKKSVVGRDEWAGCNYNFAKMLPDGTVYLTISGHWALRSLAYPKDAPVPPWTAEPCLLRVLPGAQKFDREFDPNTLGKIAGDKAITGNFEPLGETEAFFTVWHEELMTEAFTPENVDDLRGKTAAFHWYHWDMKADKVTKVPGKPFAGIPEVNPVDGKLIYADQTLSEDNGGLGVVPYYELTKDGAKPAFIGYGATWKMLRVR